MSSTSGLYAGGLRLVVVAAGARVLPARHVRIRELRQLKPPRRAEDAGLMTVDREEQVAPRWPMDQEASVAKHVR